MFEIGSSLREARVRQHLEFEGLEERTKVRAKYLRYLEEERFEQLPGHAYTKGFLQVYADALGLDGRLYVEEYNLRYVLGGSGGGEEAGAPRVPRAPTGRQRHRRNRRESLPDARWPSASATAYQRSPASPRSSSSATSRASPPIDFTGYLRSATTGNAMRQSLPARRPPTLGR